MFCVRTHIILKALFCYFVLNIKITARWFYFLKWTRGFIPVEGSAMNFLNGVSGRNTQPG